MVKSDIEEILSDRLDWEALGGKTVAVTGATGMLAAYVAESLLSLNEKLQKPVKVHAWVRNVAKASARFSRWANDANFFIREWHPDDQDMGCPGCNIIIHAASIPRPDSKRPVDVLVPNIIGTRNLLEYAVRACPGFEQFVFFSSGAVYGDNFMNDELVSEDMYFAIDQTKPQSSYAESKRMGENICVSYAAQHDIAVKILRYAHTYGHGMDLENDPRSFVDFVRCAVEGRDIELMSAGDMVRYFCYATDATRAFFRVLLAGKSGEVYNIANEDGRTTILDLAKRIASLSRHPVKVKRSACSSANSGYAPQKYAMHPDTAKLKALGFRPSVSLEEGFRRILAYYGKQEGHGSMNPPLSICIPTYNRAKYLADTLESIVRQKEFGEIEVVVSDNCSSDRTRDVALEYANQFPENIVYSRNETNLLDGNFPKALSLGRGEFLKLLNDTAPLRPGALERMLATIRRAKKHDKTLPFFINGNARGTEHILCGSLDEFIDKTRYYNTWIATFGVWREILPDVLPILRSTVASKLTQSWALLTLVSRGWNVLVDPAVVFDSVTPSKKGGYNIAEVFGHNYNAILEEFRNRSNLSNRTYKKAKRDILPFVNAYYFDPKREFAFDKTGYFKWMLPFYRWNPAFYARWLAMQCKRLEYSLRRRRPKDAPDKA